MLHVGATVSGWAKALEAKVEGAVKEGEAKAFKSEVWRRLTELQKALEALRADFPEQDNSK